MSTASITLIQQYRDAAIAAVSPLVPTSIIITAQGKNGWRIAQKEGRFNKDSLSRAKPRLRSGRTLENLVTLLVEDVDGLLAQSATEFAHSRAVSPTWSILVSDHGLQMVLKDVTGQTITGPVVPLWDQDQLILRRSARAALNQIGTSAAPPSRRFLSHWLATLLIDQKGRVRNDRQAQTAMTAAALCDFAFLGLLHQVANTWAIVQDPIEPNKSDDLLGGLMIREPRSLAGWIDMGPGFIERAAQVNLESGAWTTIKHAWRIPSKYPSVEPTYDQDRIGIDAIRSGLETVLEKHTRSPPTLTAFAVCALLAGVIDDKSEQVQRRIASAGPVADLLAECVILGRSEIHQYRAEVGQPIGNPGPQPGFWGT